jgi:hypothetical protein
MIELGGNITLTGFQERDYAELIVVKKIVGRYARQISDTHDAFEHLGVTFKGKNVTGGFDMHVLAALNGDQFESSVSEKNLFVALDTALKQTVSKIKKV